MDEKTIFSAPQNNPVPPVQPIATPAQVEQPVVSPSSYIPPPPTPPRFGVSGLLLKIGVGILVVGLLLLLIFKIIIPLFSNVTKPKTVTITYWGLWEPKSVMQPIIDTFEKEHPNIKVNYELRDIKRYRETVVTRIASGTGPDVFRFHNSWTKQIQASLAPLPASVVTADSLQKDYYPVVKSDMVLQGAIYGVPIHMDTLAMFVNDDIFKQVGVSVPSTWEDFANTTSAILVKDENDNIQTAGAAIGSYDNINRAPDIISLLFAQNKVDLKDPASSAQNITEALRFYTDFATGRDNIVKIWSPQKEQALDTFAGGNVGIFFGYSWDIFTIKAKNPNLAFSVHEVPMLTKPISIASYWAEGVSSKGKHQKESMQFLSYLLQKDTQQRMFSTASKTRLFGQLPARRDLGQQVSDNPLLKPFLVQAEYAVSSYAVSDTFDNGLNEQVNGYLANAIRGILINTSVESATETFVKGATDVLKRYGIN